MIGNPLERGKTAQWLACSLRHKICDESATLRHTIFTTLLEGGTHALRLQSSAAAVHERGQQPRCGTPPRCGSHRSLRPPLSSCTSASGGYLRTTQNFSVPLQLLYNMSFAEHALCRSVEPFNIFAMAQMMSHCLAVASAALWPLDMNALMCGLPPVCRAQECLPAHRQRPIAFRWRQLDGSQLSPKLLCVVLTPKRFHHIHTCLPRCVQTAH